MSGASLGLRGVEKKAPTDYAAEAGDVMKMMEAARVEGGGKPKKAVVVAKVEAKGKGDEMFPGLDNDLMAKADSVEKELASMNVKEAPKKITLAAQKGNGESSKDRAARFFATHGMGDMGRILGDQMSADAAKAAVDEANKDRSKMGEIAGKMVTIAQPGSSSMPSFSADSSSIDDIPLDDDDEMKAKWKAVDALRLRRPAGMAM